MPSRLLSLVLVALALVLSAQPAEAQLWKKAKEAAKRGAERAVERETAERADRAVTGVFEAGDDAVACAVGDDACARQAREEGKEVVYVDAEGTPLPADQQPAATSDAAVAQAQAPGQGAWTNYDFVPGERVLFYEDFEDTYTGNVPSRIRFVNGVMEVVEENGNKALRMQTEGGSKFALPLPETLPDRYTIEFDAYVPYYTNLCLFTNPLAKERDTYRCSQAIAWDDATGVIVGGGYFGKPGFVAPDGSASGTSEAERYKPLNEGYVPVRITVDVTYIKVYFGENRVVNIPNAEIARTDEIMFIAEYGSGDEQEVFLDNIRVAAGGRESMYDRLVADGRVVTHGVLFGTGSATIRPESTPTLDDIARTLQQHGDLRLRIEGHTDNTGSAEANQQLSERRAAAVRDYLVQREGIRADRLESAGLGQAQPAADNSTPEGRQTNRRVELVVL